MFTIMNTLFVPLYLLFLLLPVVKGTIFVTQPLSSTTCQAGQSCVVQWLDDGQAPLLSDFGSCFVGLYNGNGILVQQIAPVNVAAVHSLTFTPDPAAGPNSNTYYINFTTTDTSKDFTQYSPFFTLAGMTGSFSSPVASDTSSLTVPSSVASASSPSVSVTITLTSASVTTASVVSTSKSVSVSVSVSPSPSVPSSSASLTSVSQSLSESVSSTPPSASLSGSTAASSVSSSAVTTLSEPTSITSSPASSSSPLTSSLFPSSSSTSSASRLSAGFGSGVGVVSIILSLALFFL